MNRHKNIFSLAAIVGMIFAMTIVASAQRRNQRNDDYYGRTNININYAVKNLRNNARRFEDVLDRELDRSRYDGTRREDNLNRLAERFKNAAEDLDDEYEGRRSQRSSSDEARRVINYGSQLDTALSRSRLAYNNYGLQSLWSAIERDLVTVAQAYNLRYNGIYGRAGGNRGPWGGDRRGNGPYNRDLRATIVNLKNNARRFEDRVDRMGDRDRWGGVFGNRRTSNSLEGLSDRFRNATDKLEDEYNNRRDYNDSYDEVRRVLSLGQEIDREMSRARVNSQIRSDWNRIETDLRVLANAYNLRYNGRSGYGIGDIIRNFPF